MNTAAAQRLLFEFHRNLCKITFNLVNEIGFRKLNDF